MANPEPAPAPPPKPVALRKGTLASIVGIVAAGLLFSVVPREESGRIVAPTISADGTATLRPVSGRQYLNAYLDIAGVATACDGLTRGVHLGYHYTETQCAAMLERELVRTATAVMACTPLDTARQPYQITAVVSFAYNVGTTGWCTSTAARRFATRQYVPMCDALLMWNKARVKGVLRVVSGLDKRRHREREYCLTGLLPDHTPTNLSARLERYQ